MKKMYMGIKKTKNLMSVPIFYDSQAMHSLYNPLREATLFYPDTQNTRYYFIIPGIGGGYHIDDLRKRNPSSFILGIETNSEDLNLCRTIPLVKELESNGNVLFCTAEELSEALLKSYLPVLYEKLTILPHRVWADKNPDGTAQIISTINETLVKISADYSTQVHFGKIWQSNIFNNLKLCSMYDKTVQSLTDLPVNKTAAVIAAGPTLDKSAVELSENRKKYFIIATDTAFQALNKRNIKSDCVISIDGQDISCRHYAGIVNSSTLYVFDLCASPAAVKHITSAGAPILFTISGHPLASYAASRCTPEKKCFMQLCSGAGTVTIAACDFARQCGFSKLVVFGADFAYSAGKAYTKGTYIDDNNYSNNNRLQSSENSLTKLLFRSPLISRDSSLTTELLEKYRETFNTWLYANCKNICRKNSVVSADIKPSSLFCKSFCKFNFSEFIKEILKDINLSGQTSIFRNKPLLYALLPYIAHLKHENETNSISRDLAYYFNIAYSNILGYNSLL